MGPTESPQTLYLLDGTSQLFRAYYAITGLTNARGLPTNAVYGFTTMLRKLIEEEDPPYLGVAFDRPGPVFRHETFADYKGHRPPAPDDLNVQVPWAKQVCEVLRIPILELDGYEADDLIATVATRAREAGFDVVVVASDKDLLQLVGPGVTVLNPSKGVRLDASKVLETFGVGPERVTDVLGFMGDAVDNVPGVPGVGQKTALALVSSYGDMERAIRRAECFAEMWRARDRVLEALSETTPGVDEGGRVIEDRLAELAGPLAALATLEADAEYAERLRGAQDSVARALAAEADREKPRSRASLKRELKGLERGSSKRVWCSIAEHADQARLSKELATLSRAAPVEFEPSRFARGRPDAERARALYEELGFRSLAGAFGEPAPVPRPEEPAGEHETVLDLARLREWLAREGKAELAIVPVADEADALRGGLVGLALAREGLGSVYVPLGHRHLGAPRQIEPAELRESLGAVLAQGDRRVMAHDVKTAIHRLGEVGIHPAVWTLDTTVGAFLLDADRSSYDLERLARDFLAVELSSPGGGAIVVPREVEIDAVSAAAGLRARTVLRLARELTVRLEQAELAELYRTIDGPLLPLLAQMERDGIRIAVPVLAEMAKDLDLALARARAEVHQLAGMEFNVDSPKQLREVLFERLGLKPLRKTAKSRALSTDAQTLEELAEVHDIARRLLEYRELAKLKGTYVEALPRLVRPETGRVHTTFHPTGAATGRLSSSDPNLQNIPVRSELGRKIRAAFVPEDGFVFLASDYSQIELRVLAHLSRDPELIAAFLAGQDIHRHTAARIFDVAPDLVTDPMRRRAKAVNFGILYGMSETRLARDQGISRSEARAFIAAYFERFVQVGAYLEGLRELARRDAAMRTAFGRIRRFPQLRQQTNRAVREAALRAAVNMAIQGTTADLMKLAMLRVHRELGELGSRSRILLQVHDELLLEVPEREIDQVAEVVRGAMEGVERLLVPLSVSQKRGKSWLEAT